MHQSPLKQPLVAGISPPVHNSPSRGSRRSTSPGLQSDGDTQLTDVDYSRVTDAQFSRMTQSYVGSGLYSTGSSASLLPYQQNSNNAVRPVGNNLAGSKTKSLSLLVERSNMEHGNSNRRRMPTVTAVQQPAPRDGRTGIGTVLSYDRDQSLDRHVDRRRHHSRDSLNSESASRYHTIGGYGRELRGSSVEREYPHMGARMLERGVDMGLMRSRSIDPEFVSSEQPVLFSNDDGGRRAHDSLIIELQSQVTELNRECAVLQRDLEATRDKLASSMNSVRTFWSPELKRERAQRKDDANRLNLLVEQVRMAEAENRQHLDTIMHLEQENRALRDLSLSTAAGSTNSSSNSSGEMDGSHRDRDRYAKELKLLKRTIEEMELRIETQKQTLGTRDESIRKLMDMLQAKGRSRQTEDTSDEVKHIRQLEQLLGQKDSEMESRVLMLEKELKEARDELFRVKNSSSAIDRQLFDVLKAQEKQLKEKLEMSRAELLHREADLKALQTKVETLERHQDDHTRHVTVLRQQITTKEEQTAMLQSDLDLLRDRLREKDEILDKKSKQLVMLQVDKKKLELELTEVSEQLATKDKDISVFKRKVENFEDQLKDKEGMIASTKAKLASLQADHSASGDTLTGLEELLADKDKQIERLKDQRERAERRYEEEIELMRKKSADMKLNLESLKSDINEKQQTEIDLKEEISRLKSERLAKETQISRLELSISEKDDLLSEMQIQLRQAQDQKVEQGTKASSELNELRKQIEEHRSEAARIRVEASHLSAALREAEALKQTKDRQLNELQQELDECQEKIISLKEQLETKTIESNSMLKSNNVHNSENGPETGPDDINLLKSMIHDRDERIAELENALRESIRITAQREVVMAEQQMKLDHTERMMESLQEEIDSLRKTAADSAEQLTKTKNQLSDKDEEFKSLQADSKKQLIEVYEMKQEAILAAISEKDAHIAVLEMAPNKKTENIEEVEKLSREKLRLQQVLKDLTHSRMKLLQNRHQRSQSHDYSATGFYKSDDHEKLFQKIDFGTYFVYHNELLVDDDSL